jgi:hypothetical protein
MSRVALMFSFRNRLAAAESLELPHSTQLHPRPAEDGPNSGSGSGGHAHFVGGSGAHASAGEEGAGRRDLGLQPHGSNSNIAMALAPWTGAAAGDVPHGLATAIMAEARGVRGPAGTGAVGPPAGPAVAAG